MDEFKDPFGHKEESNFQSQKESPLLDMESFETLEASINASGRFGDGVFSENDFLQSGPISTASPLANDDLLEFAGNSEKPTNFSSNLLDYGNIGKEQLIDIPSVEKESPVLSKQQEQARSELLIDEDSDRGSSSPDILSSPASVKSSVIDQSNYPEPLSKSKLVDSGTKIKDTKIDKEDFEFVHAQAVKTSEVAAMTEKNESDCDCPFSPGAWFNPNKLHPVVAKYVYWEDPKKSGVALGASLVLLFSLKFFSVISVAAYLILALLSITISFRIYKNVLQAVQKSNDGHPFKEYLEMDIALSQDKMSQTVETLIHHLNCVTLKLRSLILVEDLVDTIKLLILAWCMTYVGAWFNGLTLIILAVVSGFTLPKVYETNKTQIDAYAELVRTKGKEVIEMVNAKMPLGKKKKDQ